MATKKTETKPKTKKAETETKKKAGRPPKEIPQQNFEKLCQLQATKEEIAYFFDVDADTLNAWCKRTYGENFSAIYAKKKVGGKISLRRAQFQLAKKSAAMAIFLGKNYLGQTDRPTSEIDEEDDGFIKALQGSADVWVE